MMSGPSTSGVNRRVAELLRQYAALLEQQGGSPFRVNAYRRAAETVDSLEVDLDDLMAREGTDGLLALPHIGSGIAAAIQEILRTGRWSRIDQLRGEIDPVKLFQTIPGIGPELARRIHEQLQLDTLEQVEVAAHDGSLESLPGVGIRRAAAIRAGLATLLQRARPPRGPARAAPAVETLLEVDREYRDQAGLGRLPLIAPRRFNPEGKAWLPILHADRGDWHFTALYSNTARAHQLGRTEDWVVLYFYDGEHQEGQNTVVTETQGPLLGRRVVRGREAECHAYYRRAGSPEG